jgi:23S rRNA pseudouridine2605 synthase
LALRLTHPRYGVRKLYETELNRRFEPADREKILQGIELEEGLAQAEKVEAVSSRKVRMVLREGKKREVRRILEALRYRVVWLCRLEFGPLGLGKLAPGEGRFLSAQEVEGLKRVGQERSV